MILFSKYHGCGNSFIIVNEKELCNDKDGAKTFKGGEDAFIRFCGSFAEDICSTSAGVGADGLIVVREDPELEMIFFNRDGSRAPMCGNGIRCFAHYCYENEICREDSYEVKTPAGSMIVEITATEPFRVKINMGKPIFSPAAIAVEHDGEDFLAQTLILNDGNRREVNSLFMGTVHTVVFTDDLEGEDTEALGREICNHPLFKEKTNVNFVQVIDDRTLKMKTYERGAGMTLACGTGACASAVVAGIKGLCHTEVKVVLPMGDMIIETGPEGDVFADVYMEGPSVKIFDGRM